MDSKNDLSCPKPLSRTVDDSHLLAIGSDKVCPVGEHSVEAGAAGNYVLHRSGLVEDV